LPGGCRSTCGTRAPRPLMRGTLILVEVSRLPRPLQSPQQLWLWWHGPQPSDLGVVWRAYSRRFDLEHTFRFLMQALNWTLPRAPSRTGRPLDVDCRLGLHATPAGACRRR
jgi:hypothetical protein